MEGSDKDPAIAIAFSSNDIRTSSAYLALPARVAQAYIATATTLQHCIQLDPSVFDQFTESCFRGR